jgi:hypothetical protein
MTESVIPDDTLLPTSPADLTSFNEAMDDEWATIGLDGGGNAGWGVDMQSEAAAGRRLKRSNFGVRREGGEIAREGPLEEWDKGVPSDAPGGIFAAHAKIPAWSQPWWGSDAWYTASASLSVSESVHSDDVF